MAAIPPTGKSVIVMQIGLVLRFFHLLSEGDIISAASWQTYIKTTCITHMPQIWMTV